MAQHGIHFVRQQYVDPLKPDEFNKQLRGAVQPGVKEGYAAIAGSTTAKVTLEPGILFTGEGDQVELQSSYADVPGLDATANAAASDRLDLIYCYLRFIESYPAPQPSYGVKLGTAGTFSLTGYGQNQYQIPVALGLVAAGASVYSAFYPFPRMYRVNHYLASGKEYVTNGDQTAMRILTIPKAIPSLSLSAGIRIEMVEAGTLSDDDEITAWSAPWHLTHEGEAGFNALLAEVVAARGSMSDLDARLDVSLNEDGSLKFTGDLGDLLAEVVQARGDKTSLDARLDVSLDDDGTLNADTVLGHAALGPHYVHTPRQILERSITNTDIELEGVLEENLADGAVTVNKIGLLAVGTNRLADYAVSNAKLGLLSVDTANLRTGAVTTNKIDDLNVTTGKINDEAVTQAKRAAKLYGRWCVDAAQSIPNGLWTDLNFATQEVANLGAGATKTSGPFTIIAARDMKLHISACVCFASQLWEQNEGAELRIMRYRGSSTYRYLDKRESDASTTKELVLSGSIMLDLNSGDFFNVQVKQTCGGATNIKYAAIPYYHSWVSIEEV